MDQMVERFKAEISDATDSNVKVIDKILMPGASSEYDLDDDSNMNTGGRAEGVQQHRWIVKMEEFRGALISIHQAMTEGRLVEPSRIKVPLLSNSNH